MKRSPISRDELLPLIEPMAFVLGQADRERMGALLPLVPADGYIRLSDALEVVVGQRDRQLALDLFRQFRMRFRDSARANKIPLSFDVDTGTRSSPSDRKCWFSYTNRPRTAVAASLRRSIYDALATECFARGASPWEIRATHGGLAINYTVSQICSDGLVINENGHKVFVPAHTIERLELLSKGC